MNLVASFENQATFPNSRVSSYPCCMTSLNLIVEEVLIETAMRISDLERLLAQSNSADERRSLQIAIAELRQVIKAHSATSMLTH
jgi:hypothetical protein